MLQLHLQGPLDAVPDDLASLVQEGEEQLTHPTERAYGIGAPVEDEAGSPDQEKGPERLLPTEW
jgi:hypothetical protein